MYNEKEVRIIIKEFINRSILISIVFLTLIFSNNFVKAEVLPVKYDLRDYINIAVRDQKTTNTCWAFSTCSLLSAHLALTENQEYSFSPRHIEYTMSEDSFSNRENMYAYKNKTLGIGGNERIIKQYFAQGNGPVLERNMPFEDNSNSIVASELPTELSYKQVVEAEHILPMYKEWVNGSLVYKDYNEEIINNEKVLEYQNNVKTCIKNYGGLDASISFNQNSYNESNGSFNQKEEDGAWHGIFLIGWDDNYSRENFNESVKPVKNGAYIALNSWGIASGDKGYMYISYEDVTLDKPLKTYIKKVEDVDYDCVYYEDVSLAKMNNETLTEITIIFDSGITGSIYLNLKVDGKYILKDVLADSCIENIKLPNPIKLEQNTEVSLEYLIRDEYKKYIYPYYYTVKDESQFDVVNSTVNTKNNQLYFATKHNVIDNGKKVNVRVLKNSNDITSDFIIGGNNISNCQTGIYITPKNYVEGEYTLKLNYNNKTISKVFDFVTGFKKSTEDIINEEIDGEIKGDISLDGKFNVVDLSQLKGYLVGLWSLNKVRATAGDMNNDGKLSILDLSLMKKKLVEL